MQKYLRELKPDKFEDLIAMNALYRPGPMEYIPNYVDRKHGREAVSYDLPEMEEHLKETYGITVYQEQVMLLAQKLAGFSKGDADVLRKAMGKKQKAVLDKMKGQFMKGAVEKGLAAEKLEKIWTDWEAFAMYAFNKSHSTCYAMVSYQTAYLKAHYPSEFMAAVLNHAGNIEKITFFMEECKRMGLVVLGPDINESLQGFAVNSRGEIRIGLGGLKGVGEAAVEAIIEERRKKGVFTSVFDLVKRVNQRVVNKKSLECLALAGAFDFDQSLHRAQYFHIQEGEQVTGLEKIVRFGNIYQGQTANTTNTLFGDLPMMHDIPQPKIGQCPTWNLTEILDKEKEITGMFLSGHPLDHFRFEMKHYNISSVADFNTFREEIEHQPYPGKPFRLAVLVTTAQHRVSRAGKKFGVLGLEDFSGNMELTLFSDQYLKYAHYFELGNCLYVSGRFEKWEYRNEWNFKVTDICLLETIKRSMTRQIHFVINPKVFQETQLRFIERNVKTNPGKARLSFVFQEQKGQHSVTLQTLDKGFEMNDEMAVFLMENPDLEVNVDTV
jgi:DNA polymerase-3 subunit alpha